MKYIFTFLLLFARGLLLFAQTSHGSFHGRVLDSLGKSPLELASVIVYKVKDSSFNKKLFTDTSGFFTVDGLEINDSIEFVVSYTGYNDYRRRLLLNGNQLTDLGIIQMKPSAKELDTVYIKAQVAAVVIRKDTVEYNAASFKTRLNAVVEELIKKLPGLEVDVNGNISFNGKPISRVLVDGRVFFGGDIFLATRNLPADMVSKIQVMDTKTIAQAFNNLPTGGMDKTLNIKLKKSANSLFGFVHGGAGTDQRYELSGMINYFDDARKISIIGSGNNVNNIGFSPASDLNIINPGNGIIESKLGGINYSDEWGEQVKVNGSYFYDRTNINNESIIARKQLIVEDSTFSTNSENRQQAASTDHRAQFTIEYTPDSIDNLIITPEISTRSFVNNSYNDVLTTTSSNEKINESNGNILGKGTTSNYGLQLSWSRKLNSKGRSFTLSFNTSNSMQKNNSLNQSKNIFFKNNSIDSSGNLDQRIFVNDNNSAYSINLSYNQPISKSLRLTLDENIALSHSTTDKNTFELDSSGRTIALDTSYSGGFISNTLINSTSLSMFYSRKGWDLLGGLTAFYNRLENYSTSVKNNLQQRQFNYSPVVNIGYHFSKEKNIRFNYSANVQQPSLEQLRPIPDNSNPLAIKMGNPNLKPSFFQNYLLGYSSFNGRENTEMVLQYYPYSGKIINAVFYDAYGRQVSQFVNVNGSFGLSGNASLMRNWKTENSGKYISLVFILNYNRDISLVNGEEIVSGATGMSYMIGSGYTYKDILSITCRYSFSYNTVSYSTAAEQQVNYILQTLNNGISLCVWKSLRVISEFNYSYNNNVPPGFNRSSLLWNMAIAKSILKSQKAQIKLALYDILKQNNNLRRVVNSNYIEDTQSAILQQYALLSITYHLKKDAGNLK